MQLFYAFRSADSTATPHEPRVFDYPWDAADYALNIGQYASQMDPKDVIAHLLATGGRYYELSKAPRRAGRRDTDDTDSGWSRYAPVRMDKELTGLPLPIATAAAFPRYVRARNHEAAQKIADAHGCVVSELDAFQCAEAHAFLGQKRPSPACAPSSKPAAARR